MAFSYELATDIGKVRMHLRDTVENSGPFPDDSNFSDEELAQILSAEDETVMRAVAACCEILATAWSGVPDTRVGQRSENASAVSTAYERRAKLLREQYGGGGGSGVAFSAQRADGYAVNAGTATDPSED